MAITFTKEPTRFYPAYNDSWIEFSSDLIDNNKAEISISGFEVELDGITQTLYSGIFPLNFLVFPDASGNYLFNAHEVAKTLVNRRGLEDRYENEVNSFFDIIGNNVKPTFSFEVFNDIESETAFKQYEFFKEVLQIGNTVDSEYNGLTLPNKDEGNKRSYLATFFNGYPFSFSLRNYLLTVANEQIEVQNITTGTSSADNNNIILPVTTGGFRFNIYKDFINNWITDLILTFKSGFNSLELLSAGVKFADLNLYFVERKCGIYLKWLNPEGGFSYWLFDEFYDYEADSKTTEEISNNKFENLENANNKKRVKGKLKKRFILAKTEIDRVQALQIESLYDSPFVQLWSLKEPIKDGQSGRFINVNVEGKFEINSKREFNQLEINIELPESNGINL